MRCAVLNDVIARHTRSDRSSRVRPVKPSRPCFAARRSSCALKAFPVRESPVVLDGDGFGNGGRGGSGDWFSRRWQPDGTPECLLAICNSDACFASGQGNQHACFKFWCCSDGGRPSPATIICIVLMCQVFKAEASPRRKSHKHNRSHTWDDSPELNRYANHLTDLAWPLLQNLGFSGAVGLVCAIALKVFVAK